MQYVAEFYVAGARRDLTQIARRAKTAADQLAREGTAVRFLRAIFLPEDESGFAFYEAGSPDAVADAGERAELPFDRIREAVAVPTLNSSPTLRKETRA
jgi:hypothetical protein